MEISHILVKNRADVDGTSSHPGGEVFLCRWELGTQATLLLHLGSFHEELDFSEEKLPVIYEFGLYFSCVLVL